MSDTAIAEAPAATVEQELNDSNQKPTEIVKLGLISVGYYPSNVTLADGREFTDHSISIRRNFKTADGWDHRSLSIKRKESLQLITALQQIVLKSYENSDDIETEE